MTLLECVDGGTTGGRKAQFYDRGEGREDDVFEVEP